MSDNALLQEVDEQTATRYYSEVNLLRSSQRERPQRKCSRCLPDASAPQLVQRIGAGVEVRLDAGDGRGKGVFATRAYKKGDVIWREDHLVRAGVANGLMLAATTTPGPWLMPRWGMLRPAQAAAQHNESKEQCVNCGHCFRFVGENRSLRRAALRARLGPALAGPGTPRGPAAPHHPAVVLPAGSVEQQVARLLLHLISSLAEEDPDAEPEEVAELRARLQQVRRRPLALALALALAQQAGQPRTLSRQTSPLASRQQLLKSRPPPAPQIQAAVDSSYLQALLSGEAKLPRSEQITVPEPVRAQRRAAAAAAAALP